MSASMNGHALTNGRADLNGHARGKRVAIVGGGLAGIAAALDCAADGAAVTLLESKGRLGGAAYSFVRDGIHADNGQHVFLRCCTAYRDLLQRIGAADLVTLQPRLAIPVLAPGGQRAWLRRSNFPAPLHLAGALAQYRFLGLAQRLTLARAMQALRRVDPHDPAADARSFGDWLAEHGQGADAVHAMWELIARPTLNLTASDASLAQAAYVFQEGLLHDAAAGDVGYAHVPLGEIHDVTARRALARAGVDVRLRRGAVAIVPRPDGFCIEVNGAPSLDADAVILAVPHDRAARLLPPGGGLQAAQLARLGTSPIVNVHVVYDRRVFDLPFAAGVRTPVQWLFDRTGPAGLEHGQYVAISLSAADEELDMTVADLRQRFVGALAELLPAARDARVETFFVTREHAATFRAAPGARALRPGPRTRIPGLVLAGTWTDTGWPATMEGAVRSGRAAAREALATPGPVREPLAEVAT
jgi:squalene-associated FAD-dependent desaturase